MAVERVRRRMADTPPTLELVDEGYAAYEELLELRAIYAVYEGALLGHMEMEGSAMAIGELAIAKLAEGRAAYFWDGPGLIAVIDGALGEGAHKDYMRWEVPPQPEGFWKVDTRRVNALINQMGRAFAEKANECKRVERMAPHVEWEEKA